MTIRSEAKQLHDRIVIDIKYLEDQKEMFEYGNWTWAEQTRHEKEIRMLKAIELLLRCKLKEESYDGS